MALDVTVGVQHSRSSLHVVSRVWVLAAMAMVCQVDVCCLRGGQYLRGSLAPKMSGGSVSRSLEYPFCEQGVICSIRRNVVSRSWSGGVGHPGMIAPPQWQQTLWWAMVRSTASERFRVETPLVAWFDTSTLQNDDEVVNSDEVYMYLFRTNTACLSMLIRHIYTSSPDN